MYQVLALKWRPQTFEELVGQGHVARTLTNAIEADRLAHSYILAGLRGTGKTTGARALDRESTSSALRRATSPPPAR